MNDRHVTLDTGIQRMISDLFTDSGNPGPQPAESIFDRVLERINATPACVRTDTSGCITEINPAFSQLCGYRFEEVKGRKPGAILQGEATTGESIEAIRQAIRERRACEVEMVNYHKDQTTYRVSIQVRPIFSATGAHEGFEALETKLS